MLRFICVLSVLYTFDASATCKEDLLRGEGSPEILAKSAYVLRDEDLEATFLKKLDGVVLKELRDVREGIVFTPGTEQEIFQLEAMDRDQTPQSLISSSGWGRVELDSSVPNYLRLEFSDHSRIAGLSIVCRAQVKDGALIWEFETSSAREAAHKVTQTHFPRLRLARISKDGDDFFHFPSGSGVLKQNPFEKSLGPNPLPYVYPSGFTTHQMVGYYGKKSGLYIATQDPTSSRKRIAAEIRDGVLEIDYGWDAFEELVPSDGGTKRKLPGQQVIRIVRGDWYDAAQHYRAWAKTVPAFWPDDPARENQSAVERIREVGVWLIEAFNMDYPYHDQVKNFADYMGVPLGFHWYRWHQIPFDRGYPHFFPANNGFKEGIDALQKHGILVMPYINVHVWDKHLDDFETIGRAGAVKDRNGNIDWYDAENGLAKMCPATEIWQSTLETIVRRLANEYGVDGIYLDQLAAVPAPLCFDPTHGHPLGGGGWWADSYRALLKRLHAAIRPDQFLTVEWNAEPFLKDTDGVLTNHFEFADQVPIFGTIFGNHTPGFGRYHEQGPDDVAAFRVKQAQAFVYGNQLGWQGIYLVGQPSSMAYLRDLAKLRREVASYLDGGQMLRPPTVRGQIPDLTLDWFYYGTQRIVTTSALQRAVWKHPDGRLLYVFANSGTELVAFDFSIAMNEFSPQTPLPFVRRRSGYGSVESGELVANQISTRLAPGMAESWEIVPAERYNRSR